MLTDVHDSSAAFFPQWIRGNTRQTRGPRSTSKEGVLVGTVAKAQAKTRKNKPASVTKVAMAAS